MVDRTATFVFFLGDRFFGTITAYVPGAIAANYHFTSAIAVQLLKAIQPQLEPLLRSPPTEVARAPFDASLPMPAERERAEAPIAPPMAAVLNPPPPERAAIDHNGG